MTIGGIMDPIGGKTLDGAIRLLDNSEAGKRF